jgi:hypothetical protein
MPANPADISTKNKNDTLLSKKNENGHVLVFCGRLCPASVSFDDPEMPVLSQKNEKRRHKLTSHKDQLLPATSRLTSRHHQCITITAHHDDPGSCSIPSVINHTTTATTQLKPELPVKQC